MNAFFVPQLGSQIYTMNGMTTQLNLRGRPARHLSRPLRAVQRRRLFRHAFRCRARAARRLCRIGSTDAQAPEAPTLDDAAYAAARQAERECRALHLRRVEPGCSTQSSTRRCRRARAGQPERRRRTPRRGRTMHARQAYLGGDPVRSADPAGRRRRRDPGHPRRARLDRRSRATCPICGASGSPASITSASASCIALLAAGDAAARLHRRDHDALAAGARLSTRRAICRPTITTRSSPRTARS